MIPDPIAEALRHASDTLRTVAPSNRDAVLDWINQLLDRLKP
jgi:hypothetical protein